MPHKGKCNIITHVYRQRWLFGFLHRRKPLAAFQHCFTRILELELWEDYVDNHCSIMGRASLPHQIVQALRWLTYTRHESPLLSSASSLPHCRYCRSSTHLADTIASIRSLYIVYLRIHSIHSLCCPQFMPCFFSSLFFALSFRPNHMPNHKSISTTTEPWLRV